MSYLSEYQIDQMSQAALQSYEMTADWNNAFRAAHEFAVDEMNVRPNRTAVLLALKIAKVKWMAIIHGVKQKVHS
jgi:hypothetical protein